MGTAYGHIAVGVDDLDGTLAALKDGHGIEPERPPYQVTEGGSRICFVRDPDDYRIELIERRYPGICRAAFRDRGGVTLRTSWSTAPNAS
jgi:hypothetical protein